MHKQAEPKQPAMEMNRWLSASILLMLSLEAALLVAGHPSAAAVDDVVAAIRLPSDTQAAAPARPWKCCDAAVCTRSIPPICHCQDAVRQCDAACKDCVPSTAYPSLSVCNDRYTGDPGPICRPWDCCDFAVCTRSIPPFCRCTDEVDQCAATCKDCAASTSGPSRRVCQDVFLGFPGPRCTVEGNNNVGN
ncbi:Bowman-Birk type trypsin inhibitor [Lolium perenne]|uniref:Bowman-Birk type trypsin inhibitor n=1 Tax=Lolium perenne TaxID=4522 RepID=UPI0021F5C881|nr:Bowman-Birk type trypsin inhibitor-like [Lolium perenne]